MMVAPRLTNVQVSRELADVLQELNLTGAEDAIPRDFVLGPGRPITLEILLLSAILKAVRPIQLKPVVEDTEAIIIRVVQVVTSGNPVKGPDLPINSSLPLSIRQRPHSTARDGYVAFSRTAITRSDTRVLLDNNSSITVRLNNFNQAWFDAAADATSFEIMAIP